MKKDYSTTNRIELARYYAISTKTLNRIIKEAGIRLPPWASIMGNLKIEIMEACENRYKPKNPPTPEEE